jgi:hypothetical protein
MIILKLAGRILFTNNDVKWDRAGLSPGHRLSLTEPRSPSAEAFLILDCSCLEKKSEIFYIEGMT